MAGYNLIVKAENEAEARQYIDDWLSVPVAGIAALGYDQFMASVTHYQDGVPITKGDYDGTLDEWGDNRSDPLRHGDLVWWKGDQ